MSADHQAMRHRLVTVRWLAVIPIAILAGWLAHSVLGLLSWVVAGMLSESASRYVRLLLYYAPKDFAFVFAGAKVAPRPLVTSVVLTMAAITWSLAVHIFSQRSVGMVNYLHFAAESAGAVLGVAFTFATRHRRSGASVCGS